MGRTKKPGKNKHSGDHQRNGNRVSNSIKSVPTGKNGRPAVYDAIRFPHIAYILCKERGFTKPELAPVFDVSERTIAIWSWNHLEFTEAINRGRDEYDGQAVESVLLRRCLGYDFEEVSITNTSVKATLADGTKIRVPATQTTVTTKHHAPNVGAIQWWLQNRNPERWKTLTYLQAQVQSLPGNNQPAVPVVDLSGVKTQDLLALRGMIEQQQAIEIVATDNTLPSAEDVLDQFGGMR